MYQPSGDCTENSTKFLQKLNSAIDLITQNFEVKEIYLFGSFAKGTNKKGSAIDLFVVAETGLPFIERIETLNDIFGKNHIRAECLVYRPSEFQSKIDMEDPFIQNIIKEGIKIYPS